MDTKEEIPSKIGDDEINLKETEKLAKSEKFQTFLKWGKDNNLLFHKNLLVPAAFGPLGVPGIAAKEDIPANTVIAAIPHKLLISLKDIKNGELSEMLKCPNNKGLFDENAAGDAEFNIIAAYLIYEKYMKEKLKQEKSFYQPYFDTIERSFTMYDWKIEEVEETECPELIDEFSHYKEDMEVTWRELKACLEKYPQFYIKDLLQEEVFLWSYELIMTRIFGYSLPCTCLVPFGDLFNHGNHSATHYIVNKKFEEDETLAHEQYKVKKGKIDLSIFDQQNPEKFKIKGNDYHFRSRRFRFVKDHYQVLSPELKQKIDWNNTNYIEDNLLREMMYEINAKELSHNKEANIWDLNFFTTSATEDNDTDEDQTEGRKKEYDTLFHKELKLVETTQKRSRTDSTALNSSNNTNKNSSEGNTSNILNGTAFDQIRSRTQSDQDQVDKSSSDSEFQGSEYESGDDSEEESDKDQEESIQQDKSESNKSTSIIQKKDVKQFKEDEQKPKNLKIENDNYQYEEDSVGSLSDDSEWEWYSSQHENSYFSVTTEQPVKKGEQVLLCYGRRTNKFLLQWYGFAFQNNLFDSFGFRMWINPNQKALDFKTIFDQIVFRKFISEDDWKNGFVLNNGYQIPTRDLTKEFRLKRGHLCQEFIVYLRIYLSSHYHEIDCSQILFTLPRSLGFEMFVFEFAKKVLMYMREQYKTTNEQDEELLKDHNINYKKRFATVVKLDHKNLLDEQIRIVDTVYLILNSLKNNQFDLKKHLEENQISLNSDKIEDKENKIIISQSISENSSSKDFSKINQSSIKEVILTDKHTNSLKNAYFQDIEGFGNLKDVVKERHKIKKYLEQLYLGIYKQFVM